MRVFTLAFVALAGLSTAPPVYAQASADVAALREKLKPGDSVTLSLSETVVRGKLLAIRTDTLLVRGDSGPIEVSLAAVNEARRKRMGIFLGPIIGAVAGVGPGVLGALLSGTAAEGTMALLGNIGLGAAIGTVIDAMVNRNRTVYRRSGIGTRVSLTPAIGPKHAGMRVSVNW